MLLMGRVRPAARFYEAVLEACDELIAEAHDRDDRDRVNLLELVRDSAWRHLDDGRNAEK